jgi:1,4-alpha-glucan branching enzyme
VLNFTPVVREHYRIGVPEAGTYAECFNSDSEYYGGSNVSNGTAIQSQPVEAMGRHHSVVLTLPPLAGIVLQKTL